MADLMAAVRQILQQNPTLAAGIAGQGSGLMPTPRPTPQAMQLPRGAGRMGPGVMPHYAPPDLARQMTLAGPPRNPEAAALTEAARAARRPAQLASPAAASPAAGPLASDAMLAAMEFLPRAQAAMRQGYGPSRWRQFQWGRGLSDDQLSYLASMAGSGGGGMGAFGAK